MPENRLIQTATGDCGFESRNSSDGGNKIKLKKKKKELS